MGFLLVLLFYENHLKKEVNIMKKQPKLELVTIGSPSISALSETEQKHFYMTLLAQILKLYKEKKQKEN